MLTTHAQPTIAYNNTPRVFTGVGDTLPLPWAGGLNSVSISAIDLNQDGKNDLVTYDLSGGKIVPFLNIGNAGEMNYRYAPQYIPSFPKTIESFILCEDYNGDGKNDLFTYFNAGIKVFKNVSTISEGLKFEDVTDDVNFPYLTSRYAPGPNGVSNLYVSRGDIPAIVDLDNDGDLDILAFGNSSATVVYHRNLAADSGNLERLDYVASSFCWGNFEESFDSDQLQLGVSCRIGGFEVNNKGNKHAGSTLLAFDRDGDGDKELLVGDISSGKMILLTNGGDSLTANMVSQSNKFPEESQAIELNIYPAAFYVDVNNDGRKDLLVSPNTTGSVENAESVWLYLNTGTSAFTNFSFLRSDFLQSEMVEQGEGLFPAWLDYNNDSLPDLVAGNHGIYNGTQLAISRLTLFTLNADGDFNINQPDMAGLSSILLNSNLNTPTLALAPSFGDLDNDGDMDLLVGDFEGKLHYFTNTSAAGEQANFTLTSKNYFDIDVGGYAVPQLFDLNGDGMLDLIIGERSGNINYYQNVGTTQQAKFELITENLGGIDLVPPLDFVGYSYPFFFHSNDTLKLLCGAQSGELFLYDQIEGNLNGDFHLVENAFPSFDVGMRSAVSGTDLDGDGLLDLAIGNYSGGLSLYKTNLAYQAPAPPSSKPKQNNDLSFEIVPVPSRGSIRLISSTDNFFSRILTIRIYDVQGKLVFFKKNTTQRSFELPFGKGAFYMELQDGEQKTMRKFMMM